LLKIFEAKTITDIGNLKSMAKLRKCEHDVCILGVCNPNDLKYPRLQRKFNDCILSTDSDATKVINERCGKLCNKQDVMCNGRCLMWNRYELTNVQERFLQSLYDRNVKFEVSSSLLKKEKKIKEETDKVWNKCSMECCNGSSCTKDNIGEQEGCIRTCFSLEKKETIDEVIIKSCKAECSSSLDLTAIKTKIKTTKKATTSVKSIKPKPKPKLDVKQHDCLQKCFNK